MSEIRVNIFDRERTISGELHGSLTDPLAAALAAEPETISEFETALLRFVKVESDWTPLRGFRGHENLEPWDAGILCIDLAARVIGIDSTYSLIGKEGSVKVPNELEENDFVDENGDLRLPYRLPDDWRIVYSIPEFEGLAAGRREERSAEMPFDARPVLFGRPLVEFLVSELLSTDDIEHEELFADIHVKWLMTPRDDLCGKTPREILLERQDFIDFDLHTRAMQYSFTKLCPRPIASDSFAYINAGFGTHEYIMYYDLVRVLLSECYQRLKNEPDITEDEEVERLLGVRDAWLTSPDPESSSGRVPAEIIETERKRLNLLMKAQECLIDDDCPLCVAMYEDFDTPGFWHYDGCNMDHRFESSFQRTREEWDDEQREYERFSRAYEEKRRLESIDGNDLGDSKEDPF